MHETMNDFQKKCLSYCFGIFITSYCRLSRARKLSCVHFYVFRSLSKQANSGRPRRLSSEGKWAREKICAKMFM